jgi:hypothetical protein
MTNSNRILIAEVPVKDGKALIDGDYAIDDVPGTGAKIAMDWSDVVGGITGKLLPTGNAKGTIEVDGIKYTVSIVDAGNPVVFINAASLEMKGTESLYEIESNKPLMETIEKIRGQAAVMCGMVDKPENAKTKSPYTPFFCIISPPADYRTVSGTTVKAGQMAQESVRRTCIHCRPDGWVGASRRECRWRMLVRVSQRAQAECVADAAESLRSRLRCYLLPLGSLQKQVEPGAEAETDRRPLSPSAPNGNKLPDAKGGCHDIPSRDHPPLQDARAGSGIPGLAGLKTHPGRVAERPTDRTRQSRRGRLLGRGLAADRVGVPRSSESVS